MRLGNAVFFRTSLGGMAVCFARLSGDAVYGVFVPQGGGADGMGGDCCCGAAFFPM